MSQRDTLIARAMCIPKDFTYEEMVKLVGYFGYEEKQGNGSRIKFCRESDKRVICLHKPHPGNIVKRYMLKQLIKFLQEEGAL